MGIKLSICIPTYNRATFLKEAIESIIPELNSQVEIVVSDNASIDSTKEIIKEYINKISNLKYFCWDQNMGPDMNFLKVVELAQGEYCWILGSDDAIKPGSINRILRELDSNQYDIILFNRTECDIDLRPIRDKQWLSSHLRDKVFDLTSDEELFRYLQSSRSLGAIFSYLSSIVFKREKWITVKPDPKFIGSAYIHVYMLLSFINSSCYLKYIRDPLVFCRGGNDSFAIEGIIKRFLIDIDGYYALADDLLSNNTVVRQMFLKVITYEHPFKRIIKIRALSSKKTWKSIKEKLLNCGYDANFLYTCEKFGENMLFSYLIKKIS